MFKYNYYKGFIIVSNKSYTNKYVAEIGSEENLSIRTVAYRSYNIMCINPIDYMNLWNTPDTNFSIYGAADKVLVTDRIELNACN